MLGWQGRINRRRSNIEIISDILKEGEKGASRTEIRCSADMSYYQIQKYLVFLLAHGFIDQLNTENSRFNYRVTDKGSKLLKSMDTVLEALTL